VVSRFQAFVDQALVAEGEVLGVALPSDAEIAAAGRNAAEKAAAADKPGPR